MWRPGGLPPEKHPPTVSTDESENEMSERMYTIDDMARAWAEGAETAWQATCEGWNGETAGEEYTTLYGVAPFREANDDIPNPYEREES